MCIESGKGNIYWVKEENQQDNCYLEIETDSLFCYTDESLLKMEANALAIAGLYKNSLRKESRVGFMKGEHILGS